MCEPRYQEFKAPEIPVYQDETLRAKVISGEVLGVKGPIEARVPTYLLDLYFKQGREYQHPIP